VVRLKAWQEGLLGWSAESRRDLPWRRTRDPWAVLVAEAMLQQTQVSRVVPRYESFLEQFPTPRACAEAPVAEVLMAWAGLGYNRRAVQLHRAAGAVAEAGGRVPHRLEELLALPGVGAYTARAVLAFAFEHDVGVLDTNAARVLARRTGRSLRPREAQSMADASVPAGQGWAWNQAVLDLGATVCTARSPDCDRCPVRRGCAWRASGLAAPDPAVGSAGVGGRQSRFEGSDRQGRGRLVSALRGGPVDHDALADAMGWPDDPSRAERVADALVAEGLVARRGATYRLP
jgi:A/G-specific adenine glycosylase